jgi:transposase
MSCERWRPERVFVYRHPVDMRKQIDGLVALVASELGHDPTDRSMYVFCNRGRDKIKLLLWHLNGYWLLYKRAEKQRFQWPDWFAGNTLTLTHEQLDYLLDGYNLNGMRPHKALTFTHAL